MERRRFEVYGCGDWETIDENIDRLQELYEKVENRIERVE